MEKSFKKMKAMVSAMAAVLVLICAMLLMTGTAHAATKYQLASGFMSAPLWQAGITGQNGAEDRLRANFIIPKPRTERAR